MKYYLALIKNGAVLYIHRQKYLKWGKKAKGRTLGGQYTRIYIKGQVKYL